MAPLLLAHGGSRLCAVDLIARAGVASLTSNYGPASLALSAATALSLAAGGAGGTRRAQRTQGTGQAVDLGLAPVGALVQKRFVIINDGSLPLTITAISTSGTAAARCARAVATARSFDLFIIQLFIYLVG